MLDTVSSPSTTQSWNLDAVGNQNSATTSGTTVTNAANAKNELTANGTSSLTFDNNGNTTIDESGNTFTFDAWNHIATVKNSSGTTIATYQSDALGRRIGETNSGGVTTASYFNGAQIIEQRQGGTTTDQGTQKGDTKGDKLAL